MINIHKSANRALVIGFDGGVGQSVMALLEQSPLGQKLCERFDEILLLDQATSPKRPSIPNCRVLEPMRLTSSGQLRTLIREYKISQVIDLSSLDTLECAQVCEEEGADFLCTSVEEWPGMVSIPTDRAISRLLPAHRPAFKKQAHLVGSGANPGIVNALAFAALDEFGRRVGAEPNVSGLDLHSILITEVDTTTEIGANLSRDFFAMTWSPAHCLEELFEPRSFLARNGRAVHLGHQPTDRWYRARCGDGHISGWAVPHEETKTLSLRLQGVDIAFIYQIPKAAEMSLLEGRARSTPLEEWPTKRLMPPFAKNLVGRDQLGVLLCSREYGEFWMGFNTNVSKGLALGTNATQLQVAAGVVAGWEQLGTRKGIHFVEDLDWSRFLKSVYGVLGEPSLVYDAQAPALRLSQRVLAKSPVNVEAERQYA